MIQQINLNIEKSLEGVVIPQYYNTTLGTSGTIVITLPTMYQSSSTMVFINNGSGYIYQELGINYTENSNNNTLTLLGASSGQIVEVRYNLLLPY